MARPATDVRARSAYESTYVDDQGRKLCRWRPCSKMLTGRQMKWCSEECGNSAFATWNWGAARHRIYLRDKGVCSKCGLHCEHLKTMLEYWHHHLVMEAKKKHGVFGCALRADEPMKELLQAIGLGGQRDYWGVLIRDCWEADHVIPLIEGGSLCDPDNLRTLCYWCHKKETAALAKRRADGRRQALLQKPVPAPLFDRSSS